jgi:hypothetical protein
MTQEDKVALKEFLSGAAVAIGITVVFSSNYFCFWYCISW